MRFRKAFFIVAFLPVLAIPFSLGWLCKIVGRQKQKTALKQLEQIINDYWADRTDSLLAIAKADFSKH